MLVRRSGVALVAVLIAGCGGGGSDDTAVSATPTTPPVAAAPGAVPSPSPTPGTNPAPTPVTNPAPKPGAGPAPAPVVTAPAPVGGPAPAPVPGPVATVSGPMVLAALQTGVSADPAEARNPYSVYRSVASSAGETMRLGGQLQSFIVTGGFPGGSGIGLWEDVKVEPIVNGGVILGVNANGLRLEGAQLDLRNVNPALNAAAGTWTSGNSFASLVIQEVPGRADLMRVCWNAHLPPPPPVTGPPGYTPLERSALFKRLMCGVYKRDAGGTDVGGYLIDDMNGDVRTFVGSW